MNKIKVLKVSLGLTLLAITALVSGLMSMISNSYEVARIRNSIIADVGQPADFTWTPENPPIEFLLEQSSSPPEFHMIIKQFGQNFENFQNLHKSLQITDLLGEGPGRGDGIKSNTLDTYNKLMTEKAGYCADYTQVFNGIAYTANIPVREWGMSFDGYSGRGHAFNEIYDYHFNKWVFIDPFNSFYVLDKQTGIPLSTMEFRQRLSENTAENNSLITPINMERFGFRDSQDAIEYYQRGADQFFLWFGNNVFSYDNHQAIRSFGSVSRAVEQILGIFFGVMPRIKLVISDSNIGQIKSLFAKRNTFIILSSLFIIIFLVLLVQLFILYNTWRKAP